MSPVATVVFPDPEWVPATTRRGHRLGTAAHSAVPGASAGQAPEHPTCQPPGGRPRLDPLDDWNDWAVVVVGVVVVVVVVVVVDVVVVVGRVVVVVGRVVVVVDVVVDDVVVVELVVEVVVSVDDVVVDVSSGGGGGGAGDVLSVRSSRESAEAVCSCCSGTPARAARIVSAKMAAGNEPPVTWRPRTFCIGRLSR